MSCGRGSLPRLELRVVGLDHAALALEPVSHKTLRHESSGAGHA